MVEDNLLQRLVELYEGTDTKTRAELFRSSPHLTRSALEEILKENTSLFKEIVPQAIDEQTGLFSKTYFENKLLIDAISMSNGNKVPLSYVLFDLDKFHVFNEHYGHVKGDEAIKKFADLLENSVRTKDRRNVKIETPADRRTEKYRRKNESYSDFIARLPDFYGDSGRVGNGEEFAVILYGSDEKNALKIANRILEGVRKIKIPYEGQTIGFTASAGIAQYSSQMTAEELKQKADKALYWSKNNGRDKVTAYSQIT